MDNQDEVLDLINAVINYDSGNTSNIEYLKNLIFRVDVNSIQEVLESSYAIDIALTLESFSNDEMISLHQKIGDKHMAHLLEQATEIIQRAIVNVLPYEKSLEIFNHMSNDDIADILGNLKINVRKELLKLMRDEHNIQLQKLLQYDEDTAGGIMTTEYISLKEALDVSEALHKIKEIAPKTEIIETIFVINNNKQLVGTADLRDIFTAKEGETLFDIMDNNIITVTPEIDQEEVSTLVSKYDLRAIPVVNKRGSMLGIITVDDIIDVLVEEQTEDMLKFGGVSGEEDKSNRIFESVRTRLPWLLINLVTASFSAFVVSKFEAIIVQVVALSAIMPIVAATSGNLGSQTLAIVIRDITLGEINIKDDWKRAFKEISVGLINSCVTGSIASLVVFIMYGNIYLSIIIFTSMFLNAIIASSCGFFIPLTLKFLKLDPALASGIFLTALTDVMAFFILLGLGNIFLGYLI